MRTARRPCRTCARLGIRVRWDMLIEGEQHRRRGFWPLALLWLPAGAVVTSAVRFWVDPEGWTPSCPPRRQRLRRAAFRSPWRAGGCGGWDGAAAPGRWVRCSAG